MGYGQKNIYIFDSISRKPIEYATIKFLSSNDGTYSDHKGLFVLPSKVEKLSISCIGFERKTITKTFGDTIFLKPKVNLLKEVLVKTKKREVYGKKKSKLFISFNSNSESVIFAKKIRLDDNVVIAKAHFDIYNDNKERKYRFHIFNLNNDNLPKENIISKNIVSEIKPNQKGITIDLTSYEIILKKGSYYFAIEIFDLEKQNINSSLKIGCYKTSLNNESLSKPVFNDNEQWKSIKTYNEKKEYSFNFYLTIKR